MDTSNIANAGELIEKGQQAAVNTTKTAVSDVTGTVSSQIGLRNETNTAQTQNQNQAQTPAAEASNQASEEDLEATKDMVRDYYAPATNSTPSQAELEEQQRQAKLAQVRQNIALELHNETYFNEIRDAGALRPQSQISEQDKIEEEKKQDKMVDLQAAKKKDVDIDKFRKERRVEIVGGPVG